ncbi:MAG: carboxypeptidase regulatory-like domain-containing protein [Geminocystis sp. GBBB08]|nr:carboxypeptidase regulatory-like domain-containing protein [Geminocystis sp. GBBB08]
MLIFSFTIDKVFAHGSVINYQQKQVIEIDAKYDNGIPMENAQVIIYSPSDTTQPWLKGITDGKGKFVFTPDFSQGGNWTIKIRSAGHGNVITIPIKSSSIPENNQINSPSVSQPQENNPILKSQSSNIISSLTMTQKLTMAITGVWGFVGTALFFSRKKI